MIYHFNNYIFEAMKEEEKKELKTRFEEVHLRTSDPKNMKNHYTAEAVMRQWKEDFIDEDTSEVVTIERHEVVLQRNTMIDDDALARIMFHMQAGELDEVLVSNQNRAGFRADNNNVRVYTVTFKSAEGTHKLITRALSLQMALQVAEDYAEYFLPGEFDIKSAKAEDCFHIIEEPFKYEGEDKPLLHYRIEAVVSADGEAGQHAIEPIRRSFIAIARNADDAKVVVMRDIAKKIKQKHGNVSVDLTLSEARVFSASDIVPMRFTNEYIRRKKANDFVMQGQRISNESI